jgi:hypothetical protein
VLIRGGIALVWAPYEFWTDGKTSHCGVFDFVKLDGVWRVANGLPTPQECGPPIEDVRLGVIGRGLQSFGSARRFLVFEAPRSSVTVSSTSWFPLPA